MYGIEDFDTAKYEEALSYLTRYASHEFVVKVIGFNCTIERVDRMEPLLNIMRDLYLQLKNQKHI